jgi:hypothetical protein
LGAFLSLLRSTVGLMSGCFSSVSVHIIEETPKLSNQTIIIMCKYTMYIWVLIRKGLFSLKIFI